MPVLFAQFTTSSDFSSSNFGPANFIFLALWLLVAGVAIYAVVDLNKYPEQAWQQSGQNKGLWMALLIGGAVLGCCCFIIGLVPIIIYFVNIKKKLDAAQQGYGGASPFGPYAGPSGPGGYPPAGPGGYPPAAPGYPPAGPTGYPPAGPGEGLALPTPPPSWDQPAPTTPEPPAWTPGEPSSMVGESERTPATPFEAPAPLAPAEPFVAPPPFEAPPVTPPVDPVPPPVAPGTDTGGAPEWNPPAAYEPASYEPPTYEPPSGDSPPEPAADPDASDKPDEGSGSTPPPR